MAITTIYTYPLTGSQREFTVPFEYLARRFVVLTLIGQDRKELVLATDFRFISKTIVQTTVAWGPADGYERIEIRRDTSATDRLVDFADGSILRASELNISQIQTLHVAEEARNMVADTIGVDNNGMLDARARRIVNVADAIEPGDAVTLRQQATWADSALNSRNAAKLSETNAKASENAAKLSETNAKASENAAKTSETNAKTSENAAKLSETNAKASENAAKLSETNAKASENAAKTSETNAKTSETNAAAWAAGLHLPGAAGSGLRFLRQRLDEAGLEYVDIFQVLSDPWFFQPLGIPTPIMGNSLLPRVSSPLYRYIALDNDTAYNGTILTNVSISGADPYVLATATISLAGSPFNNTVVRLLNEERRFLRPGKTFGVLEDSTNRRHVHDVETATWAGVGNAESQGYPLNDNHRGFRTTDRRGLRGSSQLDGEPRLVHPEGHAESRPRNVSIRYIMRIK